MSAKLARYLDAEGRLKGWPSKRSDQLEALHYLADRLPSGMEWGERELNELLKALHTFGDWALLRRDLYDARLLDRSPDGRRYWKVPPAPENKFQCKRLSAEDLKDVVAFVGTHPSGGMSPDDAHRIITGLVRGPEAVMDLHDEAGRLAVAAVVDTCANVDGSADLAILGIRGQQLPPAGFQLLFDQAEEVTRQGPRGSLDITLMPERTSWEQSLRARGYEPAHMQYSMECPGDAPLPPLRKPLPEGWRWMDAEDDQLADYYRVVSEAFSTVPGAFVPPLEEMLVGLKRAGRRPRVLVEGRRVRAFATVRVHERAEGAVGEVRTIGRDPVLRGAGLGEHALQQALALLWQAAPIVRFELEVTARNEAALKLYQRHGFRIVQSMPVFRRCLPRQG